MRPLEYSWRSDQIQITFTTKPHVSPVMLAARAKGRLEHAFRRHGLSARFSRKVAVRSLGDATRREVERYIERQVTKERFVDRRFEQKMRHLTVINSQVQLAEPTATLSGRYWYNLHLVLVNKGRSRVTDLKILQIIRDRSLLLAAKHNYHLSRLSVVPDHLHTSLRGNINHSPHDIALKFMNNLAYALGQKMIWEPSYYVGTFGEYDMGAVRKDRGPLP